MLAKKQQKPPEPTLLDRIHQLRGDIDAFVEQKVMELKNSRDGASLFTGDIRHMLLRGDSCLCRAAARLLGDPDA